MLKKWVYDIWKSLRFAFVYIICSIPTFWGESGLYLSKCVIPHFIYLFFLSQQIVEAPEVPLVSDRITAKANQAALNKAGRLLPLFTRTTCSCRVGALLITLSFLLVCSLFWCTLCNHHTIVFKHLMTRTFLEF